MIERVRFTPEAAREMREARRWYDARRPDWGKVFLKRIEECTRAIQEMGRRFPVAQSEIRRARVRQFPYEVIYAHSPTEVPIYAIFHSARDPQNWKDRLPED